MPPPSRKRRAVAEDAEESEEEIPQSTQRRRRVVSDESEEDDDVEGENGDGMDVDGEAESDEQVVKKFVRYALACEFSRQPITRVGIREKVLPKQRVPFKRIFDTTQRQLRTNFGMQMVELQSKDKVTLKDRIVEYRTPEIIKPSTVGSASEEATYIALCTVIVSIISLSNDGTIPDHTLTNYLNNLNIKENTPLDKTSATLKKMEKQGYIYRTVENTGSDETTDWRVGPRGKAEIGNQGVQGLVTEVYGESAPDNLRQRLHRSLRMEIADGRRNSMHEAEDDAFEEVNKGPSRGPSGRRRRATDDDDDE
ncbi:hypothetical protein B7494_g5727 [Chlorociboria aeruginascens]|nr:hypothetical protein B7494_g5727 [Chlorociboria aeruginascens]